ncbi:glycosyltransferase family 2 protein [Chelativorans xinjiangense]|uniref:glycosyltransferase family 2 protein n=1 Tax=Chelativorans xinjiangense TaxID=2681485 RepID=UPI00135A01F6|nr:glycosyltransferase family 2 protein [Chelativorans xinjiangense]
MIALPRISTVIPTYNQEEYIVAAVESAVMQIGDFDHEVIVSSDGSTDGTRQKVDALRRRFPGLIRDISDDSNVGISGNFKRLFDAATGDYVAILEGDDIWSDHLKLAKQLAFLMGNADCSMVFSKILVKKLPSGEESYLPRQTAIAKSKLDGSDFLAEPTMNLIANLSSCMLRADIVKTLPIKLFEGRFNEIAMAFYFERHGKLGFMNEPMSIYHLHEKGVWSGAPRIDQLRSGLMTREMVLDVSSPVYHDQIRRVIEEKYQKPLADLTQGSNASA